MAKIILISQKYLLQLFKMVSKQTECSRLERSSLIKFLVAKKGKPFEIYNMYREACFESCNLISSQQKYAPLWKSESSNICLQKMFMNGLNINLLLLP